MRTFEIIATTGNKFHIPGQPNNIKTYKRKLSYQNNYQIENELRITFNSNEIEQLRDFYSRMNHLGDIESVFLHFIDEDRWIESRIFDIGTELVAHFLIFKEDEMIIGDFIEI